MRSDALEVLRPADAAPVIRHTARVRVRYADTDQMQIVWHGKYLEYFELARTELMRECGLPYAEMESVGVQLPLVEAHCRYHAPARYDDVLLVESSVSDYHSPRLRIDYRIATIDEPARTLVTGHTVHAFQDIASGRPGRPHPPFVALLDSIIASSDASNSLV
jgi:acyl-CoA thioester hydrolase